MDRLLQLALSNAVAVTFLALIVAGVCRLVRRRPAVAAALWLIVLLKLLTPPIWTIPIDFPHFQPSARADEASPASSAARSASGDAMPLVDRRTDSALAGGNLPVPPATKQAPIRPVRRPFPVQIVLLATWLAGSSVVLLVALFRIRGFRRLLRFAMPAPSDVRRRAGDLASRLGLSRAPDISMVPGTVCPMLCCGRRPRILLPQALWERLDRDQRDALLVHELAHLRRGDHWVRLLEVLVSALYWWHPVVWLARRELRKAEEQCCDAWVVWALPDSTHSYATALVETVDFLAACPRPPAVFASGMGQFLDLKRRLVMIDQANVSRRISRIGLMCVMAGGIAGLALTPLWGQSSGSPNAPSAPQSSGAARPASAPALDAEMKQAAERVGRLRRQLDQAERHLMELDARRMAGAAPPPLAPDANGKVELVLVHLTSGMSSMLRAPLRGFSFQSTALRDALAKFDNPDWKGLVVDWHALNSAGVQENAAVSGELAGQSTLFGLSEVLVRAAGQAKLAIVVDWSMVLITTAAQGRTFAQSDRLSHQHKWDAATEAVMSRRIPQVSFNGIVLGDVLSFMQDVSGQRIMADWNSLKGRGIGPNTLVTLRVGGVWLDQALELVIESAAPTGPVAIDARDGQITISARD